MSNYHDNYFHLILNLHAGTDDTESIYEKAEEVQAEQKETEKDTTTASSGKDATQETTAERNTFYLDVKVFLEGVQVPHSSCAISYGITSPPTATVILPAASFMRDLPETTKLHVIFRDLVPDDSGVYQWRLLFDGELSGVTYSIDPTGANVSLSAIHTTAYLHSMQIITQAAAEYMLNKSPEMIGEFVMKTPFGMTQVKTKIIDTIINSRSYNSMADLVYLIMYVLLENYKDSSAVSKWYWDKLGNDAGGYKILQRIYGVSSTAKGGLSLGGRIDGSNTYSGSSGSSGGYYEALNDTSKNVGEYSDCGISFFLITMSTSALAGGNGAQADVLRKYINEYENQQYNPGGDNSNTCVWMLSKVWNAAGFTDWPINTNSVDGAIIIARNRGIWKEANSGYRPKLGDGIMLTKPDSTVLGHGAMADGEGGFYSVCFSQGYAFYHDTADEVIARWGDRNIVGYVAINEFHRST